jgi:hypothetical protein
MADELPLLDRKLILGLYIAGQPDDASPSVARA